MKTYYAIETGQKLANINGVILGVTISFNVWGNVVIEETTRPLSYTNKAEAKTAAAGWGIVVTEVLTEEQLEALKENN